MLSSAESVCVCVRQQQIEWCILCGCGVLSGPERSPSRGLLLPWPLGHALHQSLHWERPATGSQEFHTHTQMPSLRERKQKQTDQRIQNQRNTEQCLGNLAKCFHSGHIFSKIRKDVFPQTTKTIFIDYLSGLKQFFFFKWLFIFPF